MVQMLLLYHFHTNVSQTAQVGTGESTVLLVAIASGTGMSGSGTITGDTSQFVAVDLK